MENDRIKMREKITLPLKGFYRFSYVIIVFRIRRKWRKINNEQKILFAL